jgi:type IV secretion system protein VirB10
MELLDKLKQRLNENFGAKKGGTSAPPDANRETPGGMQLRPDVERGVAGLNKTIIIVAGAVASLLIFGVWYGISHVQPTMAVAQISKKIELPSKNNIPIPKSYTPPPEKPAQVASQPKVEAAAPAASAPTTAHAQAQQSSPQQQALVRALSGQGQGGGAWSSGGAQAQQTARAETQNAAAYNPQTGSMQNTSAVNPQTGGTGTPTAINQINDQSGLGVYNTHLVRKPASPYEVMQGAVIPATLTTGIESDLPGQIMAVVSRNVFDSASGAHLLVPAGSRLVGTYATKVLPGQESVAVAWNRILFPNGSYINLGTMPGTDPNGMSGISGEVDNHTWLMFKNALLLSLVGTGIHEAMPQTTGINGSMTPAQMFQSQLASTFGQTVSQSLQRYMSIAPTIHVQPGAQIAVVVSKDLVFPGPYIDRMQAQPQAPRDTAPPSMINPYPEFR